MKKIIRSIIGCIVVLGVLSIDSKEAKSFQPAAHYALIQKVKSNLSSASIIGQALREYPNIAAWGSLGPDLGYFQPSELGGYAPWADRYHYYKVGSFAKEQLKEALDSGDKKKIAFAGGWVSHVSGDLACHGIYVNPECGVYLDNEDTRSKHSELEKMADPYVWTTLGNQDQNLYINKNLANIYSKTGSIPFDLMNNVSQKIYNTSASTSEENGWCNVLLAGLNSGIGYTYTDYKVAVDYLNENGRKDRLNKAFSTAENQCTKLLEQAESGEYSNFTDRWNLDVGASESPISSLTAIVKTGTKSGAGTDDDIYFGIKLKTGDTKEWKLDKAFYNDFENGDNDEYYLYINDMDFSPNLVDKVWLEKKHKDYSIGQAWYLDSLEVNVNGKIALSKDANQWVNGNDTVYFDADWSSITNTSDPTF
ncbi:PLAT/LH2 domain-containing protein [Clostridium cibarium]|uniref:Zinc dependent phospholipase C family protein n=1 Tax=Clostridium cibarium TaxID=2762247 RepID=A0ABR8PWG1_9CLOT|nr:zinc dependent phospholipase C family protein [Clostridium cibarium]MBD7912496.1 zinc dependent phospholipase C family protein [Clostridium cibarium]